MLGVDCVMLWKYFILDRVKFRCISGSRFVSR